MPITILDTITGTDTFVIPSGTTNIHVFALGGGANGSNGVMNGGDGGGAGAMAYAYASCTPGDTWNITFSAGEVTVTKPGLITVVKAVPGSLATGGAAASCVGDITESGANGGTASGATGGGGGGAPALLGSGGTATGAAAGTNGAGGGGGAGGESDWDAAFFGGDGGNAGSPGANGGTYGGGGGGGNAMNSGGTGGGGVVIFFTASGEGPWEPWLFPGGSNRVRILPVVKMTSRVLHHMVPVAVNTIGFPVRSAPRQVKGPQSYRTLKTPAPQTVTVTASLPLRSPGRQRPAVTQYRTLRRVSPVTVTVVATTPVRSPARIQTPVTRYQAFRKDVPIPVYVQNFLPIHHSPRQHDVHATRTITKMVVPPPIPVPLPIRQTRQREPVRTRHYLYNTLPLVPPQVPLFKVRNRNWVQLVRRPSKPMPMTMATVPLVFRRLRSYPAKTVTRTNSQYIPAAVQEIDIPLPMRQTRTAIIRSVVNRPHPVVIRDPDRALPILGTQRQVIRPGTVRNLSRFVLQTTVLPVHPPARIRTVTVLRPKTTATIASHTVHPLSRPARVIRSTETAPNRVAKVIPSTATTTVIVPRMRPRFVVSSIRTPVQSRFVPEPPVQNLLVVAKTRQVRSLTPPPARVQRIVPAVRPNDVLIPKLRPRFVSIHTRPPVMSRFVPEPAIQNLLVVNRTRLTTPRNVGVRRGFPFAVNRDVSVPTPFPVARIRLQQYKVQCPQRIPVASIMVPPPFVTNVLVPSKRVVR